MADSYRRGHVLQERVLKVGDRSIRITLEAGDALWTEGDALIVKYAQASYGLDGLVVDRLSGVFPGLTTRLPLPGQHLALESRSIAAAPLVVFIGTPPLERFGYDAVRTWGREALAVLPKIATDVTTAIVTVHGVQMGFGPASLDEQRSLIAQLTGFTDALEANQVSSLEWIRIVERDPERAKRLANALGDAQLRDASEEAPYGLGLSSSVRTLHQLGDSNQDVTAGELARRLQTGHEHYANDLFGNVPIEPGRGPMHPINYWLNRVTGLYDETEVARSKHRVLDGRLLLAGLATVDEDLYMSLSETGVLSALWDEIDVKPRDALLREDVALRPDEPAASSADLLGRQLIARSLAEHLEEFDRHHPGRSFLIHVDGRWGAGKSTLLAFLIEEVKRRQWCVVEFDAWRQSRAGPPWLLLLTTLRATLRRNGDLPWHTALQERWRLLGRTYQVASVFFLAVLVFLIALSAYDVLTFDTLPTTVLGVLALVGAAWASATSIGRFFSLDSRRGARAFIDTRSDPMEDVARHFAWLRASIPSPLVLVIDDLDRCDQEYVVELLDNTQKLVRDEGAPSGGQLPTLFIVVAADGRWLRRAYELAHGRFSDAIGEPGRPLGSLFLDKLFQMHVPVPELSPRRQLIYLDHLLGVGSDVDQTSSITSLEDRIQEAVTNDEVLDVLSAASPTQRIQVAELVRNRLATGGDSSPSEAEHALSRFAPLLEPNPRSMLRFVMAFSVLRAARLAEGNPVPTNELALWTIVTVRWPALAEFLQQNPERVNLFLSASEQLDAQAPPELRQLLANPSDEIRKVFNHHIGGPLTDATIRECSGLS
jgi:hypothetical protein